MRALVIAARDSAPSVSDIDDLKPGEGEVRVSVEAASLNGFDLAVAAGYVWDMLPHTFPVVLGRDFAGTVESLGADVVDVSPGDRVAGVLTSMELGAGPIAEHIIVPASSVVAIPTRVSSVEAAGVGLAGIAALDAIEALDVSADDVVLISGATGGVGVLAVQLAAARGARVIATARAGDSTEVLRGLGATDVVDYTEDPVAAVRELAPGGVSKVLHAAGDPAALASLLVPGGLLLSMLGATAEAVGRDDIKVVGIMASFTPAKLARLLEQVADGHLVVAIAGRHSLAESVTSLEAFRANKLGKIVVTIP